MTQHIEYDPKHITFSKLTEADLPLMHRWLNTAHVHEWFKEFGKYEPTLPLVFNKYLPRIQGNDPVNCYFVLYNARQVAYIQWYRLEDFPASKAMVVDSKNIAGSDTFIGEVDFLHKKFGEVYIRKFLKEIVFHEPAISACIIDPEPTNKIAIRAYEKAGFRYVKTVWNPIDKVWAYVMTINRESVYQ